MSESNQIYIKATPKKKDSNGKYKESNKIKDQDPVKHENVNARHLGEVRR